MVLPLMTESRLIVTEKSVAEQLKPEQESEKESDSDSSEVIGGNLNATAYRIFKLLVWLSETPLSVDDLNGRFYHDPSIRKRLSNDSVWLYINTLKALGCDIRRPMRSNGFKYELVYHPFGIFLSREVIDMLVDVKALAEEHLEHPQILALDRFFKKIIRCSGAQAGMQDRERHIEELFSKSRSWDYGESDANIQALQVAIDVGALLQVSYQSPVRGKQQFYFLPDELVYQNGVMYLMGIQHHRAELSMLRLERIDGFEVVDSQAQPQVMAQLQALKAKESLAVIRFFVTSPKALTGMGLGDNLQVERQTFVEATPDSPAYLELNIHAREFFGLKQVLLSSGLPFQVMAPDHFKQDMLRTLYQMSRLYEGGEGSHG